MIPLKQVWPDDMAALYRAKGYWRGETFSQVLRSRAEAQPDAVAVVGMEQRWTYGDLLEKAEAAAAGFLALGLKPGDRVVVQLPNLPEFLSVIFGLFRAQLIPVYALPAHRSTEIVHFVARAEASAYVVADRHEGFDYRILARAVQGEIPDLRHVVVVGEAEEFAAFDEFLADPAILPVTDADPSSVAFLQISGGSTGLSKLIPRTHDDYLYSVRESADISGLEPESVYLTALPAAHNFPMSSPGYLGALYVGATVVMAPSPSPDACFPLIEREGVTITGLVPPLALLWMQAASRKAHDLSSLQVLLVGGAKFLPEAARRVRTELGCTLQQVFGMAEGLVNYTRLDDDESLIVETQGRPISPDDEILILDDAGAPVLEGEAGDLLTRGPYTIRAYHNEPGANARSFTDDGFYRTGDVVRRTPEGYLVVMGRATDHINRAGEKISAEEVEDHLLAHPAVFDAAVVSVPDEYLGERICAFVIPRGDAPRGVELKAWMRQRDIAAFKVPDQIVFVEDFAVTAVGKVSRRELRAALRQRIVPEEDHA
ncbi:AMP-binding protein [Brevundimonas sp.]|uniref:(2,3-dihydroxybenzoyl)adenylate synthase n=1 Tax=Brevundimonas sp. TaxID=1871086 RepID=UPI0028A8BBCB|nr:AMP-binding protein [Brevundimonas sp.]